jgi:hypothetical protein
VPKMPQAGTQGEECAHQAAERAEGTCVLSEVPLQARMRMTLTIPMHIVSWNQLARKNRWTYVKIFNDMKLQTFLALKTYGRSLPKFTEPVSIVVNAKRKAKRQFDADNICAKSILDMLVDEHVLQGDDLRYVKSVTLTGEIGCERDAYELTISDC